MTNDILKDIPNYTLVQGEPILRDPMSPYMSYVGMSNVGMSYVYVKPADDPMTKYISGNRVVWSLGNRVVGSFNK
jgi:hypothetical protein